MKLGGIKVSSAELERLFATVEPIRENAAIAVPPPGGGPSELVVYAVLEPGGPAGRTASGAEGEGTSREPAALRDRLQRTLRERLNPLFKVAEVRVVTELPRTASNKVMRRTLRARYLAERGGTG
jgi:acetyl-CoA synthetase